MKGFGKFYLPVERVIAVLPVEASIVKKIREAADFEGKILDLSYGKKTRSVILLDSGHVVLSSLSPKSVVVKIWGRSGSGQ